MEVVTKEKQTANGRKKEIVTIYQKEKEEKNFFFRVYGQEVSAHVISTQDKNYNRDKYISWEWLVFVTEFITADAF